MLRESPDIAFQLAVSRLNRKNDIDLLLVSSLLSCIEYFDGLENKFNFLMPTINVQNMTIFPRSILESRAAEYKSDVFTSQDIAPVFNALNDAALIPDILDGPEPRETRLIRFLATMASSQFRFQERTLQDRLGRVYAFLHVIPIQFREELQRQQKDNFLDLPVVVPQIIGMPVRAFLLIGFGVLSLLSARFTENFPIPEDLRDFTTKLSYDYDIRQAKTLSYIIDISKEKRKSLIFFPEQLVVAGSNYFTKKNVQLYFAFMSRTKRQLHDLLNQPEYNVGHPANRLNPLERHPIVQISNGRYIVPSLRFLDMAMTDVIHYILQENYPDNRYNHLRGYIQEHYLRLLITSRLPHLEIIPEISYMRARQRVDGPDLTLVDRKQGQLIVIESKAKRIRVASRVEPGNPSLIEKDFSAALDAFQRVPQKIEDMYAGIREYSSYQEIINETKDKTPLVIVVLGEGVYLMPELIHQYLKSDRDHFLNSYPFPYSLTHIVSFEDAVELAAQENMPLFDVFMEYIRASHSSDAQEPLAEAFSHRLKEKQFTKALTLELFKKPY